MATHTANMLDKAHRLATTGRCHEIASAPEAYWVGVVEGDHGRYLTTCIRENAMPRLGTGSVPPRTSCTCYSGQQGKTCSHVLAARESVPVDEDALFARLGA